MTSLEMVETLFSMTEEYIFKTLQSIQSSVPKQLKDAVIEKTAITPTMDMIVDKALEDDSISQEKKDELSKLKEAGYFSKEKFTENHQVRVQIDNYVNREIKKAIKEGRLPNKKQLKELQKIWKEQSLSKV